jgi:hypothetical protein
METMAVIAAAASNILFIVILPFWKSGARGARHRRPNRQLGGKVPRRREPDPMIRG